MTDWANSRLWGRGGSDTSVGAAGLAPARRRKRFATSILMWTGLYDRIRRIVAEARRLDRGFS